jgi:hypothetical protein
MYDTRIERNRIPEQRKDSFGYRLSHLQVHLVEYKYELVAAVARHDILGTNSQEQEFSETIKIKKEYSRMHIVVQAFAAESLYQLTLQQSSIRKAGQWIMQQRRFQFQLEASHLPFAHTRSRGKECERLKYDYSAQQVMMAYKYATGRKRHGGQAEGADSVQMDWVRQTARSGFTGCCFATCE